ncbi:hypothetical protein AFLA_004907 [Aspergillus flavus NRRL3357]|nr:hypothetical protein AFLA_004907 [Aspergillus flavus NRRL3357]
MYLYLVWVKLEYAGKNYSMQLGDIAWIRPWRELVSIFTKVSILLFGSYSSTTNQEELHCKGQYRSIIY